MLEVQRATTDMKGAARLDEIRASLAAESKPAVTSGGETAAIENTVQADAAPSVDTTKKKAQPG
jgi:hypothetical protein